MIDLFDRRTKKGAAETPLLFVFCFFPLAVVDGLDDDDDNDGGSSGDGGGVVPLFTFCFNFFQSLLNFNNFLAQKNNNTNLEKLLNIYIFHVLFIIFFFCCVFFRFLFFFFSLTSRFSTGMF